MPTWATLNATISNIAPKSILSGRVKRFKSMYRKMVRPGAAGRDLWSMVDIVGFRVIVSNLREQDLVTDSLTSQMPSARLLDYRDSDRPYRAVHLHAKVGNAPYEIQIRTLPQHLWGEESESFGELVKAGGGPGRVRSYLAELSLAILRLENEEASVSVFSGKSDLFDSRRPLSRKLTKLQRLFESIPSSSEARQLSSGIYLVLFDRTLQELVQLFKFTESELSIALQEFNRLSKRIDESRFDILLLNSSTIEALAVSHSCFFPHITGYLPD